MRPERSHFFKRCWLSVWNRPQLPRLIWQDASLSIQSNNWFCRSWCISRDCRQFLQFIFPATNTTLQWIKASFNFCLHCSCCLTSYTKPLHDSQFQHWLVVTQNISRRQWSNVGRKNQAQMDNWQTVFQEEKDSETIALIKGRVTRKCKNRK
jgi:hypothetical protein